MVTNHTLSELARQFLALHHGPKPLVLPNAWDVASARIFEEAGFPAIGTTSAGIANSLGYPDGQRISRAEMLGVVRRIADAVNIPVTADMESGYGASPEEIAETAREVLAAGAVGMNLEDMSGAHPPSLADLSSQTDRISAVVEAAEKTGVPFVLNARTDIFLAARSANSGCAFKPATVGTPPVHELEALGVTRVSLGSGAMRATLSLLTRMARELRDEGTFSSMNDGAITYAETNRLFER